jgi:hypothetical protein
VKCLIIRQIGMAFGTEFGPWCRQFAPFVEPRLIMAGCAIPYLERGMLESGEEELLLRPMEMVALQAGVESHHRSGVAFLEFFRPVAPGAGEQGG